MFDAALGITSAPQGNEGIQVLLDHRPHGGIGSFYGNGLGSFHAYNYAFSADAIGMHGAADSGGTF